MSRVNLLAQVNRRLTNNTTPMQTRGRCQLPCSLQVNLQRNITPKVTPNSSQKALMSTLAFATMFESGMKKNHSAIRASVRRETGDNKTGEGSKTDEAKSSMLLDILSSGGNKIKRQ
ncbi:hypothetical protein F3Y22_tig00110557pilonHSYRG00227 [Hibiscus syriacus]|uniref:Uncharacterized protein n=1 Tax=Hibiscus syriacus TaxID=106335 RepID=A0A6A3A7K3_HIBSY|nr:hypothetical protein F3Y22_tig00110557pilonHSYRG00227 [Hibiscus syriacus]